MSNISIDLCVCVCVCVIICFQPLLRVPWSQRRPLSAPPHPGAWKLLAAASGDWNGSVSRAYEIYQ